jgi:hypothetical protein
MMNALTLRTTLCLVLLGLLPACEFPLEVDTPQLNANAHAELVAYAESGSCTPGVFKGNLGGGGDIQFTRECTIHGSVYIDGNPDLLLRLRHVKEVIGVLYLGGSVDLADALPDLEKAGQIDASAYAGSHLTGPASLREISSFDVEKNDHIQTISGFDGVQILAALGISKNTALVSVSGFNQITNLIGLQIEDNPKLASFTALANWSASKPYSYYSALPVTIANCPALLELPKFPALTQIGGDLTLMGLNATKIDGFPALKTAKSLKLNTLPKLTQLSFPELGEVGLLQIFSAPALTSLAGLPKIKVLNQVAVCVDSVSCAEVAAFKAQQTNANWIDCSAPVACKP